MRVLLAGACAVACAVTLSASQGQPPDPASRTKGARQVVVAQVEDVEARFDVNEHGDRLIISRALLRVEETLKGVHVNVLQMDFEGGTIGDLTLNVSDMQPLKRGERAVFFLQPTSSGIYRPHDRGLGVAKVDANDRVPGFGISLSQLRTTVRAAAR